MDKHERLREICEQYDVVGLYVFGSRAREVWAWLHGEQVALPPAESDVDVGIKAARPLAVREKVRLAIALEDFMEVARVDLVDLAQADPFLAANIIRGERLFAADAYRADEYDLYILRRAGDLIPLERERQRLILERKS